MKHLLLASAAVALVIPAAAHAGSYDKNHKSMTKYEKSYHQDGDQLDFKVKTQEQSYKDPRLPETPQEFALSESDGTIYIDGEAIYYITESGFKYPAPDGPYETSTGVTYYSEDGLVNLIEGPMQVVYVDTDLRDTNNNGYIDDINYDTRTHRAK